MRTWGPELTGLLVNMLSTDAMAEVGLLRPRIERDLVAMFAASMSTEVVRCGS